MRAELSDRTLVRAGGTLALVAALGLLGSAWIDVSGGSQPSGTTGDDQPAGTLEAARVVPPQPSPADGSPAASPTWIDPDAPARWPHSHVVEAGESLPAIADRYGLPAATLAEANALHTQDVIRPGDVLLLPDPERPRPASVRTAADEAPELAALLQATAAEFGLAPETVKAVAWVESRWDHGQVSDRGAVGVMQLRPQTAKAMAEALDRPIDPHDVEDNVLAGVAYLDRLAARYDGDLRRTLLAYVQGPTRLDRDGPLPVAERYVDRVHEKRSAFADQVGR